MIARPVVGSLVRARSREWVVLPGTDEEMLMLRPLGGSDDEITGIYLPLEGDDIEPATFTWPDASRPGDFVSCRLLRDAVRLGFRNSAGPFRSFARINVEPRAYQLVPLLMALKLSPVRLLIADDVGIGKTIEAALVARELLDRGEIRRLAVLCPPHLVEQWQAELSEKFGIEAELVTRSTVRRLEHNTAVGESLFDIYPFVIVSMDYIKLPRRRDEFVRACPECVIVDEAHTCAFSVEQRGRHLRHQLLVDLARDPERHLLLVTATPHSGDEGAFRSLLSLLNPSFATLPNDLSGEVNQELRREIAAHLVQRRRGDLCGYMDENTPFPERLDRDETYHLSAEYSQLFDTVLDYAREQVLDRTGPSHRQRVRWWSALALLRSLASSPAAAEETLRNRSLMAESEDDGEIDAMGARVVLDLDEDEGAERMDIVPGANELDTANERLLRYARRAHALYGPDKDTKLAGAIGLIKGLMKEGCQPILFCRFIATAEYVAQYLRQELKGVEVAAVTGQLAPAERESRVRALGQHPQRVLVATDCLSEGINLQEWFDAVVHYDLSWNPTRHEQREGRADRYGQKKPTVRTVTYYGTDNKIDGLVLDVLLRKHRQIRTSLGISVPIPGSTDELVEAIRQGLLLRGDADPRQMALFDDGQIQALHARWDNITARETRSRTLYAQHSIRVEEVSQEWQAVRQAMGSHQEARRFLSDVIRLGGGTVRDENGSVRLTMPQDQGLREAMAQGLHSWDEAKNEAIYAGFELPVAEGALYLTRTHPLISGAASHILDTTMDPLTLGLGRRCGVMRTPAVNTRTTLLLLRLRYHLIGQDQTPLLAEECQLAGFEGGVQHARWLDAERSEALLAAVPEANVAPAQAQGWLAQVIDAADALAPHLRTIAEERSLVLRDAHQRVRQAAKIRGGRLSVESHKPDVLAVFVLLPL